ncbi:sigma-54 interaction domain-containing protein [Brevibacillus fluminis]|uniref:sigma-54 interaction domain-containing protein n=1 Tax=Brevibacillus fluminis TaxID=511487 RepID=UPI003F8C6557
MNAGVGKVRELLAHLTEPLPFDVHVVESPFSAGAKESWPTLSLPQDCLIVERVFVSGVLFAVREKKSHAICMNCHQQQECPVTTAIFSPVLTQSVSSLAMISVPKTEAQQSWFQERLEQMTEHSYALGELLVSKLGVGRSTKETEQLKKEISALLSLTSEAVLVVDAEGQILELNQPMCTLMQQSRLQLLGASLLPHIGEQGWKQLKRGRDFDTVVLTPAALPGKKENVWKVRSKSIYETDKLTTMMLHITEGPAPSKKKLQQKRTIYTFDDIKGNSSSVRAVKEQARRIASGETTIMIRGESGTGKEVFAQAIHCGSQRHAGPFVAINCAAIPESLLESELFGYEGGAFTGAKGEGKAGRFELAHGGTIFLDEIGDMSLHLQAKLLRVVQERKVERVGGTHSLDVDVRIIAATHRNLEKMVAEEKFREDLYYRLNVIPLNIPPLRERKDDIPILVEYFMKKLSLDLGRTPKRLSQQVLERLLAYRWPGNIRELENVVEHFVQLEIGDLVTLQSIPLQLREQSMGHAEAERRVPRRHSSESEEKESLLQLLDQYGRDTEGKRQVAETLGVSLPTLYRKLKKWRLK